MLIHAFMIVMFYLVPVFIVYLSIRLESHYCKNEHHYTKIYGYTEPDVYKYMGMILPLVNIVYVVYLYIEKPYARGGH